MADVKNDDENNKLCATRRSAGIPFFVQVGMSGNIEIQHLHSNSDVECSGFMIILWALIFMDFIKLRVFRIHIKLVDQNYLIFTYLVFRRWKDLNFLLFSADLGQF